jgi:hypothetical protein
MMAGLAMLSACSTDTLINSITSLGGDTAGGRGALEVVFVNNTPYRAIFTFGAFDPQDQTSVPEYSQYVVDSRRSATALNRGLSSGETSSRGLLLFTCGRLFSLGGAELLERIDEKEAEPLNNAPKLEDALREGVYFTSSALDSDDPNGVTSYDLRIDPVNSLLGVDYECDSLLIYTFNYNSDGQITTTLDVIASDDTD